MRKLKIQVDDDTLYDIFHLASLMLDKTAGFRIVERGSGFTVSKICDLKRLINRSLGKPEQELINRDVYLPEIDEIETWKKHQEEWLEKQYDRNSIDINKRNN